jgi:glycosyltransferase involved in cell wall biosynthesis
MGAVLADRSDVVIAVTPSLAGLVAAAIGKKRRPLGAVVQDLTGNAASESGTTSGRAAKAIAWAEYLLLRRADLVGVITPQFGAVLRSKKIKAAAIEELPNFTHISAVSVTQATARLHLGWPEHGFSVVHTGNMGMKQGLEAVVDAARLSDERGLGVNFILVGDGNQRPFLEQMAGGIPTLRFVDPVDSKDYPFALAAADALLIHERAGVKEMSLPSKLTSYSAANRPILAVLADGGITQIVVSRERAALVVQPGDPSALLDAAIALRENAELSRKFTDAAKDMFERSHSPIAAKQRYVNFAKRLRQQKQNDAIDARSVGITNQTAN